MSTLIEEDLKFKLIKEQLEDGSFNESYIEVEVGNGKAYIRGTDANQLMMDVLEAELKQETKKVGAKEIRKNSIELPYPLCIVEDRYGGAYSGASFLAFNMSPMGVSELPIDAGDAECLNFWDGNDKDYDLSDFIIGKGNTPEEALQNLVSLLESKEV